MERVRLRKQRISLRFHLRPKKNIIFLFVHKANSKSVYTSDPSMKRWQCIINNDTLKSVVWSSMNETSIFMTLKTIHFQLWFLYKSGLLISPAGKYQN